MAKATTQPEVEETEDTEVEETNVIRPSDLAEELDVSAKALRGFLRREFPRPSESKNTSWVLNEDMVAKARAHFAPSDEDEDEDDDETDEA